MKKFLVGTALAAAVAAVLVGLLLTDASLQRIAESWLSQALAREIAADGDFAVTLGDPLRITASRVRLGNPGWATEERMATAELVELAISPRALFGGGAVVIEELRVEQLRGTLLSDAEGRENWQFGDGSGGGASILIRQLELNDGQLRIERHGFAPVDLAVARLSQVENEAGLLQTELEARLNGRDVAGRGTVGPFPNLLAGENVRLAFKGQLGALTLEGLGVIDSLADPRQPRLSVRLAAPDAAEVAEMLGVGLEISGDVDLQFSLLPVETGVRIETGGRWGSTALDLAGSVSDLQKLDGLSLQATGKGPSLQRALALFGYGALPDRPFSFSGKVSRDGELLDISELDLEIGQFLFVLRGQMRQFPSLNDANLNFSARGDDVASFRELMGLPGIAQGDFTMEGELKRAVSGKDEFRIRARTELGKGYVDGSLGRAPDYLGTTARFRANGENFRRFGELLGVSGLKEQAFELQADLERVQEGFRVAPGAGLDVGDAFLRLSGMLGQNPLESGTRLDWELGGVDVSDLGRVAGLTQAFPARKISASGQLTVRPADVVLTDVNGTLGQSLFRASGQVGRAESLRGTDLRIWTRGEDLSRLQFLAGESFELPAGEFEISARLQRSSSGIRITDSEIYVAGAEGKADMELELPVDPLGIKFDVELQGPDVSAFWKDRFNVELAALPFSLDMRGELNEQTWQFDDGLVQIGDTKLEAVGALRRGRDSGRLQIRATSPEISEIGRIFGIRPLPGRSLTLSGTLVREDDTVQLRDFLARTNKGDLGGLISYTNSARPYLEADLSSRLLDVTWMTERAQESAAAEREAPKIRRQKGGRLIPDWELPLEFLNRFDADISLSADEVSREQRDVRNLTVKASLSGGALKLEPVRFDGNSGTLDAAFKLTPVADSAEMSLVLAGTDLVSGLFQPDNTDLRFLPKGDWQIDVRSRGATLQQAAATLNGTIRFRAGSGRVENTGRTNALFGDLFTNIVDAVNPFSKQETYTEVRCAVFPFIAKDGVLQSAPSIVVQTDKLNIISRGKVNLKNERLDLSFSSKPRSGLGISAGSVVNPFVRIGGTLADPAVTLDKTSALVTGGAAFFTAGLSLLAQAAFDAAWRSPNPCAQVLEEAKKRLAEENGRRSDNGAGEQAAPGTQPSPGVAP